MKKFKRLKFEELVKQLNNHTFKQLHVHHTWKPNHSNFNGNNYQKVQKGMYNHHTRTNGWNDIGQHLTLFPDGVWLTGRPLNKTPASIRGWNTGALAVEMVGNFDKGHDNFKGRQKEEMLKLANYFIKKHGESSIKFHREGPGANKSCPGTSINKASFISQARQLKSPSTEPNLWAKPSWDWASSNGYLDGKRPHDSITRQELVVVLERFYRKIKE